MGRMNLHQFLTANLEALAAAKEPVASWLASGVADIEGALERVFVNAMGLLDWRMDDGSGVIEKSPILPVLYDEWRKIDTPERDATVIVGVNLGYGLNHVLTGTPDSHKVLVIEPRPDVLLACLGQTDYRPFIQAGKLRFVVPSHDQVEAAVQRLDLNLVYGSIHLRNDLPSQQIGPEYAQMTHLTRGKLENFSVELATLRLKQEVMVGNELQNYSDAMNHGSLLPLKGTAQGVTAVILGAGPSLADNGPLLAKRPGHALYASALQTLPAMERVGLKPDFCLAIDFRDEMMRLYDNIQDMSWLENLPLIYSTKMDPGVVRRYPGPKIPLWTMGGLGTYVFQEHELVLDAGGNVGVTLARFLSWCGVSRIVLAGQDFSWPGDRTHAPGHHAHQNVQSFDPNRDVQFTNLWGQTIYSNVGYLSAKRDLEKDLRKAQVPIYNIYGGGAEIEGSTVVDVEECHQRGLLASQPGAKERFLDAIRRVNQPRTRPVYQARHNTWNQSLRQATKHFEKFMKKPGKHQLDIKNLLNRVLQFLKQDPLYLPYLYNEVMDMASMVHCRAKYAPTDMKEYRDILKRALNKVKEMDGVMGPAGLEKKEAAA
ncbi:motility associated factor glycosyltransferase family protein [Fundidesulfovibrio terrae]|uniref:motility associated factor glycosyltransferase family protein n=1 Tax=Fundidesulfovibrio terrae TaxID=2922866 RepID=UPI001FB007EE|nr:6-hydroxymethylpterin diphosphokinase MptE-like protein [Fundidesulfovibrio terrae]